MSLRLPCPVIAALLLAVGLTLTPALGAQDSASTRKLLSHSAPPYPALARNMALAGLVKLDVLVEPDGSVKSVAVLGGHPVLAQAAVNTLLQWKWEPATHETHELVQIKFSRSE